MSIYKIITQIKNTPSTNEKKEILSKHKNNETLKKYLRLTIDTSYNWFIKAIPPYTSSTENFSLDYCLDFFENQLAGRKITGNAARDAVSYLLSNVSATDAELLSLTIEKKLRCGIDAALVNDVFPALIKDWPYQRCDLITEKNFSRFSIPFRSEIKKDGQFINLLHDHRAVSRNGKEYNFREHFTDDLNLISSQIIDDRFKSFILLGETLVLGPNKKPLPRTTSNGIVQKFGKGTGSDNELKDIVANVWDILPEDDFFAGECTIALEDRLKVLAAALEGAQYITQVIGETCHSLKDALNLNTKALNDGEEGTIIKDLRAGWKSHTSPYQLKMKLKFQVELKVIGFIEGTGSLKGSLGSVICESSDGKLKVNVGSGFKIKPSKKTRDDELRSYVWGNRERFLNMIITAEAVSLVNDKSTPDMMSLFNPTFIEWRYDKSTADDLPRIKEIVNSCIELGSIKSARRKE